MGQRRTIHGARMLITGASQGIGRSLAIEAAKRGAQVLAAARSELLLDQLADQVRADGGIIETVAADVTSAQERQWMVDAAEIHFGGLDVLVNNAAVGATGHFCDSSPERLRAIMEVNFFGTTETTRVFLPMLKRGKTPAIVNISSIVGKRGIPSRVEYSASKFAVQGFSEALRAELYKEGVDVLVICPGLTRTNFSRNMLEQKARMPVDHMRGMSADDAANAILRAIQRGSNETVLTFHGKLLTLVNRFLPRLADVIARKHVARLYPEEIRRRKQRRSHVLHRA